MSISTRIQWIEYKNKELLYIDCSGLYGEEYFREIANLRNFIIEYGRENIHMLLNASNTFVDTKFIKEIQKNAKTFNTDFHSGLKYHN